MLCLYWGSNCTIIYLAYDYPQEWASVLQLIMPDGLNFLILSTCDCAIQLNCVLCFIVLSLYNIFTHTGVLTHVELGCTVHTVTSCTGSSLIYSHTGVLTHVELGCTVHTVTSCTGSSLASDNG